VANSELNLCGLVAVRSRFKRDPMSIKRLFFDEATGRKIGMICQALAAGRKVYRCLPAVELEKIAGSIHHGGIVAVIDAPKLRAPDARTVAHWAATRTPLVLLDRIGNAHNLGAIARTAAFFGVENIVIPAHPQAALPGEAAFRVSEGGLEQVEVWRTPDLAKLMRELAVAGYDVVGAAARGGKLAMPAGLAKPVAVVLGNEEQGLAADVERACTRLVTIPGSGRVESLNVSVAGAVLIYALLARRL
jgi:RNA methyltransferase, TrmH family